MRTLNLKLTGERSLGNCCLFIDDEHVKFKKNKFGNLVINYKTEKERISIEIFNVLDFGGIFWFLTQIFFFVISIFGIFDIHHKQKYIAFSYKSEIHLKEDSHMVLRCNPLKDNTKAFNLETNLEVIEEINIFFVDENARRKRKLLAIIKATLFLVILGFTIGIFILK